MYKYKVVIADDEIEIRNGLNYIVTNECPDLEVVGVYMNGNQVINHLKSHSLDIVIMDICMPVQDGIDVLKYIEEHHLETKAILITGYRDFKYANQAIQFGAYALITKPIDFDELIKSIEEIVHLFRKKGNDVILQTALSIKQRNYIRTLFQMMVAGLIDISAIPNYGKDWKKPISSCNCAIVEFSVFGTAYRVNHENLSIWQYMCDDDNDIADIYCIKEDTQTAKFLVIFKNDESKEFAESFAKESVKLIKNAYRMNSKYEITYYKSIKEIYATNFDNTAVLYLDYLIQNNVMAKNDFLKTIESTFNYSMLLNFINVLLLKIETSFEADCSFMRDRIKSMKTNLELMNVFTDIEKLVQNEDNNTKILRIKNYIINHWDKDVSLISIANIFSLNPSYLSRFFKKETEENFTDYIIRVKINKAKELLTSNKYSIEEIPEMLGYSTSSYFSRVFKSFTGLTPKQYMNMELRERRGK